MSGGRPRKPKHIKEAQGTLAKSREVDHPAMGEALSVLPSVPVGMGEHEEKYFLHCAGDLLSKGLLTAGFLPSLEMAASWYALFIIARNEVRSNGAVQVTQSGYTQITGSFTTMDKTYKNLVDFENRYGFNLVSSQKISMPAREKGNKYFD